VKEQPRITHSIIRPGRVLDAVRDNSAGGNVIFLGTIRDRSEGEAVKGLVYQVYKEMAERKMLEIEGEVRRRWPVKKVAMIHRYGSLKVGEISVAVAVSSEHRAEAFEACRYAIDRIKRALPLWKKERRMRGRAHWVKGVPIQE
jgi:molybdopterin synthase catalytic subunit